MNVVISANTTNVAVFKYVFFFQVKHIYIFTLLVFFICLSRTLSLNFADFSILDVQS